MYLCGWVFVLAHDRNSKLKEQIVVNNVHFYSCYFQTAGFNYNENSFTICIAGSYSYEHVSTFYFLHIPV